MSNGQKIATQFELPLLEFVEGSEKGKLYKVSSTVMSIGRSEDNDVVIDSDSISRKHATLARQSDGNFLIVDNGSKNGVVLNGEPVEEAYLQDGDLVQLGTHLFRFVTPSLASNAASLPVQSGASAQVAAAPEAGDLLSTPARAPKAPVNPRILIYVVVLLVGGAFLLMDDEGTSPKKEAKSSVADSDAPKRPDLVKVQGDKSIAAIEDPLLTRAEQRLQSFDATNSGLREAERYFRRGQRDYSSKNYLRAIRAFQSALTFDQNHPLAKGYLQLVVFEADKNAKQNYEAGVKYFQSLQYSRAIYHFKQVIALTAHLSESKISTEAKKYISISKQSLKAAELYP